MDTFGDTLEAHLHRHSVRGRAVYLALVTCVSAALAALPLVRVGVAIEAPGMIRPMLGQHEVQAPTSGHVDTLYARQHERVSAGAVLVRLADEPLRLERLALDRSIAELAGTVRDLEQLVSPADDQALQLSTPQLMEEHAGYLVSASEIELRLHRATGELRRVESLFSLGLIAASELEDEELRVAQLESELRSLRNRYREGWQRHLRDGRERRRELEIRREELRVREARLTVRSPVEGTVEELASVSEGSFIQAGQSIARISPAGDVFAEVLVPSRDIGLLAVGLPARLLVDAYNYHDWGVITGRIVEIAEDASLVDRQPRFRVLVGIDRPFLELRNGFRAEVRKGMTFTAKFMISERTLWQLLRDDIDRWMNPLTFPA